MIARDEKDIASLREGGARLAHILRELVKMVAPGVSTRAFEDRTRELVAGGGDTAAFLGYKPEGARRSYPAALCLSVNDCVVHGIPNENPRELKDGDLVTLDMGLRHNGLITDAAVSVIAGTGDTRDVEMIAALNEALRAGIAAARPGGYVGDIGAAVQEVAEAYGFNFPRELGGHGVGRRVHEEPFIPNFGTAGSGPELLEGMVLAIEPMMMRGESKIYLDKDGYSYKTRDGSTAGHVEHTILITKDGPEILTEAR